MSKIGKNIRKIRATKGLSQSAFANLFNITRASIGAYEEGRAEPKTDTILQIANYFSIPIDALLTKELTVNQLAKFNLKSILDQKIEQVKRSIPLITSTNWDSFIEHQTIGDSSTIDFPDHYINGEIAFEITNQIQSHLDNGTLIICSRVKTPKDAAYYFVISTEKSFVTTLDEIQGQKLKNAQYFIIHQKIENLVFKSDKSLEERVDKLENELKQLIKQLKQ